MHYLTLALFTICLPLATSLTIPTSVPNNKTGASSALLGTSSLSDYQQASSDISQVFLDYDLPFNELGASVFSLIYGYPLASYRSEFEGSTGLSALGTNKLFSAGKPADASTTNVVKPNVDTEYAQAVIDLSAHDLVLTLPPMQQDRYYLFAFYDPFGDNYASLGVVNASQPGDYLLRPSLRTGHSGVSAADPLPYQGCVDSPTMGGTLLVRVELKQNDTTDIVYIINYLNQIKLTPINNHTNVLLPLSPSDFQNLSASAPEQTLQLTAHLHARNLPQKPAFASAIEPILHAAGIDSNTGVYVTPPNVNLTQASAMANATLSKWTQDPHNDVPLNNGWSIFSPNVAGTYLNGTDIVARVVVAEEAYLQNSPDEAIYPQPPQQAYQLQEGEAYILTVVGGRPPVKSIGFWSLTLYNAHGFLVSNPRGKYDVSDRSNLTYSDGSLVYSSGNNDGDNTGPPNRPFQVLVQSADVQPPANWTANWLPAPTGGTDFQLAMRPYAPTTDLVYNFGAAYQYPTFEKVSAIRS